MAVERAESGGILCAVRLCAVSCNEATIYKLSAEIFTYASTVYDLDDIEFIELAEYAQASYELAVIAKESDTGPAARLVRVAHRLDRALGLMRPSIADMTVSRTKNGSPKMDRARQCAEDSLRAILAVSSKRKPAPVTRYFAAEHMLGYIKLFIRETEKSAVGLRCPTVELCLRVLLQGDLVNEEQRAVTIAMAKRYRFTRHIASECGVGEAPRNVSSPPGLGGLRRRCIL